MFPNSSSNFVKDWFVTSSWGPNYRLAQSHLKADMLRKEAGLYKTKMCWSRSDRKAKAQSKPLTQGFCSTNTSRSALSLANRQVGQQLRCQLKTCIAHTCSFGFISVQFILQLSLSGLLQAPGQWPVNRLESPFFS